MSQRSRSLGALTLAVALVLPFTAAAERVVDRALEKASQVGDLAEMQRALELGAEPNQAYALFAAVQAGQLEAVKFLLAHGADPNAWTRINLRVPQGAPYSPIYVAASQGNRRILAYLVSHGADVNAEWNRDRYLSQSALGAAILAGDLPATQLLIEYGADVNHVPSSGDMPLSQSALAPKEGAEIAQLLLRHGADPDLKNAQGISARQQCRYSNEIRNLIEQTRPATPSQLEPEDPLEVAMALHYKALCDVALPGYRSQVAADYSRWRISQAKALSQIETSPDFTRTQADAQSAFEQAKAQAAQAGEAELQRQMKTLHRICEVGLIDQFRFGMPVSEAGASRDGATPIEIQPAAAAVQPGNVTHRAARAVGGGMMSHP
jgi:hypothetical protein